MGEYSVVLDSSEPVEGWHEYVDEFVRATGKMRYDVARIIRNARGIAFDSLKAAEAGRAASVFEKIGRSASVVKTSLIPPLDPVYTIRNADCTPEGLMVQIGYTPKMRALPWAEVRLISACSARRTRMRKGPALGSFRREVSFGPRGMRVTRKRRETERKEEFAEELCDVFTLEPVLHVRFESKGFNYDYLAERLAPNAFDNFCLFVSDLVSMSPSARLAAHASLFADGRHPPEPLDLAEFDAVNRHALALLSLGA